MKVKYLKKKNSKNIMFLQAYNANSCQYDRHYFENLLAEFEFQVRHNSEKIAIVCNCHYITYDGLGKISEEWKDALLFKGVKKGALVGIVKKDPVFFLIALLSIFKVEANPIIFNHDKDFNYYMEHESNDFNISFLIEPNYKSNIKKGPRIHDFSSIKPQQYKNHSRLIYTFTHSLNGASCSTVDHKTIRKRIFWEKKEFSVYDNIFIYIDLLKMESCIVLEYFRSVFAGGTIYVIPKTNHDSVDKMLSLSVVFKIKNIFLTVNTLKKLLKKDDLSKLRNAKTIFSSAPCYSISVVKKFQQKMPFCNFICFHIVKGDNMGITYSKTEEKNKIERVLSFFHENENPTSSELSSGYFLKKYNEPRSYYLDAENFLNDVFHIEPKNIVDYINFIESEILPFSINVASDKYIGHMTSALPKFMADIGKLLISLNQNVVKVETSLGLTHLERQVICFMHREIYNLDWDVYGRTIQDANYLYGIATSCGSISNITALWYARITSLILKGASKEQIKLEGSSAVEIALGYKKSVIIGSEFIHYSFKKAASLLGIGESGIVSIPASCNKKASTIELEKVILDCIEKKYHIIAIVGLAGSTETGCVDPLSEMAVLSKKYNLHFHVDAAWGGAFIFSHKYKHLLEGIEKADTVTICPHKQLYLPVGLSLCLFKSSNIAQPISINANYQSQSGSFDFGQYTLEGSRPAYSLLLHAALHLIAADGYDWLINSNMAKTAYFSHLVNYSSSFELIGNPDLNIINYRYIPENFRNRTEKKYTASELDIVNKCNEKIQVEQFKRGRTFVSKTKLFDIDLKDTESIVFRVVLSNPLTSVESLLGVLWDQLQIACEILGECKQAELYLKKTATELNLPVDAYNPMLTIRPSEQSHIYIINENSRLSEIGSWGKLYHCYFKLKDSDLAKNLTITLKKINQYEYFTLSNQLLYKTDIVARWLPDGSIEYLTFSN